MDSINKVVRTDPIAPRQPVSGQLTLETLPPTSGKEITSKKMGDHAASLAKEQLPDVLSRFVNHAVASAKITLSAFEVVGKELTSLFRKDDPWIVFPLYMISIVGAVLYGGSLLASAAIKAAIWLPTIGVTAAFGGIGAFIDLFLPEERRGAKQFLSNVMGSILGGLMSVPAGFTFYARGPLVLPGMLGACMMSWLSRNKDEMAQFKLSTALYHTLSDTALIASHFSDSIWRKDIQDYAGKVDYEENQYDYKGPKHTNKQRFDISRALIIKELRALRDMGANIYAVRTPHTEQTEYALSTLYDKELLKQVFDDEVIKKLFARNPKIGRVHFIQF